MNQREYLRSQGFTVGERGRFSAEMKAALAAAPDGAFTVAVKAEPKARKPRKTATTKVAKATPKDMPQTRNVDTLYALVSIGKRSVPLGFQMCTGCRLGVRYCPCKEPRATIDTVSAAVEDKSLLLV